MGFLSWEKFRCQTDCTAYPDTCISANLYMTMADLMVQQGYAAVGYEYVNVRARRHRRQTDPRPDRRLLVCHGARCQRQHGSPVPTLSCL